MSKGFGGKVLGRMAALMGVAAKAPAGDLSPTKKSGSVMAAAMRVVKQAPVAQSAEKPVAAVKNSSPLRKLVSKTGVAQRLGINI